MEVWVMTSRIDYGDLMVNGVYGSLKDAMNSREGNWTNIGAQLALRNDPMTFFIQQFILLDSRNLNPLN